MAARRTRAAARRAALVPFLSELSDDEIEAIGYLLADPLAPRLAVALSSCSRGLRRALAAPLKELKERRQKAEELCAFVSTRYGEQYSCDVLRDATRLGWRFTDTHLETLGMLLTANGFTEIYDVTAGMTGRDGWIQSGLPVVEYGR